jgi:hypothetical protein
MINHTSVVIERTSRLPHLCLLTIDRIIPALERISAVSINKPEATKYKVFDFLFIIIFVYLFIPICVSFIFYLLLLVFVKNLYLFS